MNILVLSWRDPKHPLSGGAEQVAFEHMKGWAAAGHKVVHFSSFFKGCKEKEYIDSVLFIRRGLQLIGVQIAAFFWYLFGEHIKFDLVVDEFHGIPFFTPLYIREKKLAILQEVAREVWLKNDLPFPFNFLVGIAGYILEPSIYLFYRSIPFIVGSESAKEELEKIGIPTENIKIVHHGVIVFLPKVMSKKEKVKTIVFLGALAKDKGIEDAIKTFSILSEKGNFNFWIIGRGSDVYISKLQEMCSDLGIRNQVKFWGYVTQKKKFDLLSRSHVMLNPSLLEGWGLVNIEANSVGIPVVAYNSPGLIDSVKNGKSGVICRQNSPEELANETLKILNNNKKYKYLAKEAISWSKKFSWERSRKESLTLVNNVVKLGSR